MNMSKGLFFLDEFLFFTPKVYEALIPTFATGASVIMISSLARDNNNPIMKLLSAKKSDGTDFIKILNWIQVYLIINKLYGILV